MCIFPIFNYKYFLHCSLKRKGEGTSYDPYIKLSLDNIKFSRQSALHINLQGDILGSKKLDFSLCSGGGDILGCQGAMCFMINHHHRFIDFIIIE